MCKKWFNALFCVFACSVYVFPEYCKVLQFHRPGSGVVVGIDVLGGSFDVPEVVIRNTVFLKLAIF